MNAVKTLFAATALISLMGQVAFAKTHSPEALTQLIARVALTASLNHHPVVLFDLDDTLINTRERTLRVLRDFAAQPEIQSAFPEAAAKVSNLRLAQLHYLLTDTLNSAGVTDEQFAKQANDFWVAKFFSDEYCAKDLPIRGAALYLHQLVRAGATIVYLTGRDIPRMGEGTRQNLIRNRFPSDSNQATLLLKPDPKMDDLKFKESQYPTVAGFGEVVGVFENEPANINSQANAFPEAEAIFLDTAHSPKPDVPLDRVEWVGDFRH